MNSQQTHPVHVQILAKFALLSSVVKGDKPSAFNCIFIELSMWFVILLLRLHIGGMCLQPIFAVS